MVTKNVVKPFHPNNSAASNMEVSEDVDQTQRLLPKPDITQMTPYKPKLKTIHGEHHTPGNCLFVVTSNTILIFKLFG